jgi:hypothetical protein
MTRPLRRRRPRLRDDRVRTIFCRSRPAGTGITGRSPRWSLGASALAAGIAGGPGGRKAPPAPPLRRSSACPPRLTSTVRTRRTAPRAITELVPSPGVASANWLTIAEPRVAPGASREWGKAGRFPITSATAMLSPRARPTARVRAAAMPVRAPGRTAVRMTYQRVAPIARAASRSATGTPAMAVRLRVTTEGRAMTARTTEASRMLGP